MRGEAMPTVTRQPSGERWSNADLLFLASALDQGMSVAETAGSLKPNRGSGTQAERADVRGPK